MKNHTNLAKLINHAYTEVEYYRKMFKQYGVESDMVVSVEDLSVIPVVTRKDLCDNEQQFVAKQFKKYPGISQLDIQRAFGIDGMLLRAYWSHEDAYKSFSRIIGLRNDRYGIKPEMKCCMFHGAIYRGNKLFNYEAQTLSADKCTLSFGVFGLSESRLRECYQLICDFKPDWLLLHLSMAVMLADFLQHNQLSLPSNLKYLEIQCVSVSDIALQKIREIFRINAINVVLMVDTNRIAYTCYKNRLHIFDSDIILETLDDGKAVVGKEGDILITTLNNYAMPLIRYETGLRGVLSKGGCQCGSGQTLRLATLSYPEVFNLNSGVTLTRMALDSLVEVTNENMQNCIHKYTIEKYEQNVFHICFELKTACRNWGHSVKEEFVKNADWPELQSIKWELETYAN